MGYQEDAQDFLEDFLAKLSVGEKEEQLALAEGWDTVSTILESKINTLVEIAAPSRNQLYQTDKYKDFLKTAKEQVSFYSGQAEGIISGTQADNILMGEIVNEFVLGVPLGSIPIEATNNMIGMTSEGAPLYDLLSNSYPETVMNLTDTLIEGTALGKNPEDIARDMVEDMDGNFSRALTIARTEEMNAFREASREAMTNSGMIEEWEWLAEPDACDECLEQNGKTFPIDEPMDTHPNCRCAELPVIPEAVVEENGLAVTDIIDAEAQPVKELETIVDSLLNKTENTRLLGQAWMNDPGNQTLKQNYLKALAERDAAKRSAAVVAGRRAMAVRLEAVGPFMTLKDIKSFARANPNNLARVDKAVQEFLRVKMNAKFSWVDPYTDNIIFDEPAFKYQWEEYKKSVFEIVATEMRRARKKLP